MKYLATNNIYNKSAKIRKTDDFVNNFTYKIFFPIYSEKTSFLYSKNKFHFSMISKLVFGFCLIKKHCKLMQINILQSFLKKNEYYI